jgi:hypothetical protein
MDKKRRLRAKRHRKQERYKTGKSPPPKPQLQNSNQLSKI